MTMREVQIRKSRQLALRPSSFILHSSFPMVRLKPPVSVGEFEEKRQRTAALQDLRRHGAQAAALALWSAAVLCRFSSERFELTDTFNRAPFPILHSPSFILHSSFFILHFLHA